MNRAGLGWSAAEVVVGMAETDLGVDVVHLAAGWQPAASQSFSDTEFVVAEGARAAAEAALTETEGCPAGFGVVG